MVLIFTTIVLFTLLVATLCYHLLYPRIQIEIKEIEVEVEKKVVERVVEHDVVQHLPWRLHMEMDRYKSVEDLRNTEKGKMAYILGSGASIDYYPNAIWDTIRNDPDVIVIGINQAFVLMPCDYQISKESTYRKYAIDNARQYGTKIVFSQYECGNYECGLTHPQLHWDTEGVDMYMFSHVTNPHEQDINTRPIREEWPNYLAVSFSTVTSAVSLAWLLGVKHAVLVGCDMGTIEGRSNYKLYEDFKQNMEQNEEAPSDFSGYQEWVGMECLHEQLVDCIEVCHDSSGMVTNWAHPFKSLLDLSEHTDDFQQKA
jgi:hypothetical protein